METRAIISEIIFSIIYAIAGYFLMQKGYHLGAAGFIFASGAAAAFAFAIFMKG